MNTLLQGVDTVLGEVCMMVTHLHYLGTLGWLEALETLQLVPNNDMRQSWIIQRLRTLAPLQVLNYWSLVTM